MLQPGQELSPEEVVAMKRDEEQTRLSTLLATPMGKAMFSDGPEYTPEEVVTMQAAEAQAEIPAEQVLVQQVLELNDPNAPDQPKDEWRRRTQLKKTLQEQGLLDSDFMATAKGVGGLVVTIADGATSPFRYDPRDENGNVIPAKNALEYVSRYSPATWPEAQADAALRLPATLNYAGELLEQGYGIMNDGLAGMGGPRYKIKETGEFITEMDRAMYRTKVAQTGGLAGDPSDDALIKQYAGQGMTLVPVTPEDVEEFEYQQHLRFRKRLKSMEQKRTEGVGPEVLTASAMSLSAAPLDWLTGSNYMDQVWGKKLPAESQAMALQMGADPLVWTSFGAGLTRLGVSTAAKGGGARILDAIGKGAQRMARPTEQSLREVQRFQNAVWSKGRVALYAGGLAGMNYSSLPEPLKNAMNVAAAAYVIHKGGAGTLRWVGDKFPQAAVMLREAADPLNGADIMARQAIAKNPKIPAGIRERVAKPSQFMAMESTPARLARNETLSPKTRKMMERLSNFYVVQGVRGASAVATGATKGAIVSAPFAELTRGGGDEEGANLIYGAGTALGGAGGAASRVLGARNRTVARAESDIGRMLVDIQATVPELQRQGAVKRNQWFDRELNRFLTDVELAGGDIAHMFQARSFDEIARTAAMQGLFRNVDYVPLNDADFALNAKAHGQSGAAGFYLHNPDGARPRLFVNLDARRADVDAHEFGEAFFSSDAFSPEQKAAMRAEVDARYGPEGVMARAREYAEQMIKSENARNFPNENLVVSDDQIRAKMDELAQDELGRGGQDPMDWARREIMVEEWRMAGTDYARLRRGVPAGANPVTYIENILGANARALGLSGVRIDPETGQAITPEQLFKENPVAADDPIVNRNLRNYIKTYNAWLNDPSQEVPSGVRIARDGNAQSLANNPNVDFYSINPDDPTAPRENTFGVLGPDGRVIEKSPKQRRDERKARNSQVKNMAGRNLLAPGDPTFGLKRWADGRVRAGGRRLPQSIILQNHWKPWLPIINTIESLADSGESMQVRYFAKGNSADKVKTSRFTDVDAINREVVFDQWTTNADGDLLAQLLDMTTLRNRAMRAIAERNPALDSANGGPGYSLQAIMDDVNQWMTDKRAGKAGEATIGPDRKNIVNALINPGTALNRGKNPIAGTFGKGSAIKTLLLEGINAVSGTGRKGAAMDYNWANGNFMPDQSPPRPDVDIDLPQESMPQQIPREAQGMPDMPLGDGRTLRYPKQSRDNDNAIQMLGADAHFRQVAEGRGEVYGGRDEFITDPRNADVVRSYFESYRKANPWTGLAASEVLGQGDAPVRGVADQAASGRAAGQSVVRRGQAMPDTSDAPPFYMKSTQVLDSKIQGKAATVDQVRAILTNPQNGIKAEELKWTGVLQAAERLAKENNGKVPKDALLKYLADDGAVRLEEMTMDMRGDALRMHLRIAENELNQQMQGTSGLSQRAMSLGMSQIDAANLPAKLAEGRITIESLPAELREQASQYVEANKRYSQLMRKSQNIPAPRFGRYQLDGGSRYREVVLTMPARTMDEISMDLGFGNFSSRLTNEQIAKVESIYNSQRANANEYTSSHFPSAKNYVAHMRVNERLDADGRSGLFIEELQSDRHQAGREKGYASDRPSPEEILRQRDEVFRLADAGEITQTERNARLESIGASGGIPDAPFRKDWPMQMFKRALADAVTDNKEWIGWTTGDTQASRYNKQLADNLDTIEVRRDEDGQSFYVLGYKNKREVIDSGAVSQNKLSDLIGKDMAAKAIESKDGEVTFSGKDLTIGGKGMEGFYDQILPKEISKYVKQWDGKVEKVKIGLENSLEELRFQVNRPDGRPLTAFETMAKAQSAAKQAGRGHTVVEIPLKNPTPIWRVNITPQMRESIKKAGQALFVGGSAAVVAEEELR
jgi:hypothetical protein